MTGKKLSIIDQINTLDFHKFFHGDALSELPDDQTFATVLGQAIWLMSMDPEYRGLPIKMIEGRILPPILLRQFKLYSKGKQPVAFLTWASLAEGEVLDREAITGNDLKLWRTGENVTVVDCVSPFNPGEVFEEMFLVHDDI